MNLIESMNKGLEKKYALKEATKSKKGLAVETVLIKNKDDIWAAMATGWKDGQKKVLELLKDERLTGNPDLEKIKGIFSSIRNEKQFLSTLTAYLTGISMTKGVKNESISKRRVIKRKDTKRRVVESYKIPAPFDKYYREATKEEVKQWMKDTGTDDWHDISAESLPDYDAHHIAFLMAKPQYEDILDVYSMPEVVEEGGDIFISAFSMDELYNVEDEILDMLAEFNESISKKRTLKRKMTESYRRTLKNRAKKLKEGRKRDLWNTIYGKLTDDGEQRINPKTKKPMMNLGAGYDYMDQISTDRDGNIVVRAAEERDLKAAIDIANKYSKDGVTYNISKSRYGRYPYWMTIEIPEEYK